MILCECGCGGEIIFKWWHKYEPVRYLHGHNSFENKHALGNPSPMKDKKHTEYTKELMSINHYDNSGKNNPNYGVSPSQITKERIGRAFRGKKQTHMHIEKRRKSLWKGGRKIAIARSRSKRERELGFIPLNECREDGWVGHHIDKDYVIFIPEKLHKSVWHAQKYPDTMDKINDIVYDWFVKEYLKGDLYG